jgi:hypothetical protein
MPALPLEQRQSALGCDLGEITERMRDQGIAFGYHNTTGSSLAAGTFPVPIMVAGLELDCDHSTVDH